MPEWIIKGPHVLCQGVIFIKCEIAPEGQFNLQLLKIFRQIGTVISGRWCQTWYKYIVWDEGVERCQGVLKEIKGKEEKCIYSASIAIFSWLKTPMFHMIALAKIIKCHYLFGFYPTQEHYYKGSTVPVKGNVSS